MSLTDKRQGHRDLIDLEAERAAHKLRQELAEPEDTLQELERRLSALYRFVRFYREAGLDERADFYLHEADQACRVILRVQRELHLREPFRPATHDAHIAGFSWSVLVPAPADWNAARTFWAARGNQSEVAWLQTAEARIREIYKPPSRTVESLPVRIICQNIVQCPHCGGDL